MPFHPAMLPAMHPLQPLNMMYTNHAQFGVPYYREKTQLPVFKPEPVKITLSPSTDIIAETLLKLRR